ncbi:MAG: hypothetical protein AAF416_04655 [Pseudomonadota bacterium]
MNEVTGTPGIGAGLELDQGLSGDQVEFLMDSVLFASLDAAVFGPMRNEKIGEDTGDDSGKVYS